MFLHYFSPSPILLNFGWLEIRWYGFLITLAVIASFFIARILFKKYHLALNYLYDLYFYLIIFGLLGARLWHVFSEINYYWQYPVDILKIWNGGLAIHGVLLAGILVIYFFARKHKDLCHCDPALAGEAIPARSPRPLCDLAMTSRFFLLLDIFAPLLVLGQALGRWGNYFNQELYGLPSNSVFAIPIDLAHRLPGFVNFEFFHPIFLYESAWCLLVFAILIYLHKKLNPKYYGLIFASYLILYSLERFLIGFLRPDPQFVWLGFRQDQWVSLILIITGLGLVWYIKYRKSVKINTDKNFKL